MLLVCVSKKFLDFCFVLFLLEAGNPPFNISGLGVEKILVACNHLLPLLRLEILEGQAANLLACSSRGGWLSCLSCISPAPLKRVFSLLPPTTCQNKKHPVIYHLLLLIVCWGSKFSKIHHGKEAKL